MAKRKFTSVETYIQIYQNVKHLHQTESDWLNDKACRDTETQKRLVEDLEATMRILSKYPGIHTDFTTIK